MSFETLTRKYARLATDLVMRNPRLWRLVRPLLRLQFDRLAPRWTAMRSEGAFAPFEAALERVGDPRRALDLGTGTGLGAFAIAERFPEADVVGIDVSRAMIEQARTDTPPGLRDRIRFEIGDASRLPFDDGTFDLVAHSNMIPFFDELARVIAPGGFAIFAFSGGAETPIYVPAERLREELGRRGFTEFADISAGAGTALVARAASRT